jgi:hypothetical protein
MCIRHNDKAHRQAERSLSAATGYSAVAAFKEVYFGKENHTGYLGRRGED